MTTTPTLRAQVLALRRTQSARTVAQDLSIPLGTVKAISSRSGLTRDNHKNLGVSIPTLYRWVPASTHA